MVNKLYWDLSKKHRERMEKEKERKRRDEENRRRRRQHYIENNIKSSENKEFGE